MKPKKAPDEKGIVAELLRCSSERMIELIAKLFTDVLKPEACIPDYWKMSSIKVLLKKGE